MRIRDQRRHEQGDLWEPFDPVEWPEDELDIDDEEFARAIAAGRGDEVAA